MMGTRGKVSACAAVLMLLSAPAAIADEEIVAGTPNRYQSTQITIDQGEKLTFRNTDIVMHDVVSDAKGDVNGHLFASDTIGGGSTSFVEGSQSLTTGTYGFYCSVHPDQMKGTLTVSSAGTPAPRPGTGGTPPPAAEPLQAAVTAQSTKASRLRSGRKLKASIGTNKASTLDLTVSFRGARVGHAKETFTTAGSRTVAMTIKKSVRRKLHKGSKLKLTLVASDESGTPQKTTTTVKLG